jgi:hypothetical protein
MTRLEKINVHSHFVFEQIHFLSDTHHMLSNITDKRANHVTSLQPTQSHINNMHQFDTVFD